MLTHKETNTPPLYVGGTADILLARTSEASTWPGATEEGGGEGGGEGGQEGEVDGGGEVRAAGGQV